MRLYEVSMTGADGEALNSQERMAAYRFNQKVFAREREVLVLFDEIEDVFPSALRKPDRKEIDKAWVNQLLVSDRACAWRHVSMALFARCRKDRGSGRSRCVAIRSGPIVRCR